MTLWTHCSVFEVLSSRSVKKFHLNIDNQKTFSVMFEIKQYDTQTADMSEANFMF